MSSTDAMDDVQEERIQSLVRRAAKLDDAARHALLSHEFAEDATLREQVYTYLLATFGKSSSTERKIAKAGASPTHPGTRSSSRHTGLIGDVLGDYRLRDVIGAGGVGTVYRGERADQAYSSQVAVKVLTNASLSHDAQRRFGTERQILASLSHPYIARLLDGGETQFNESFLVMEYVQGTSIDHYCDNEKLTIKQRLQLFIKVCQAVQYAHRNLVVHRDLKPANILVTADGTPKLLDFGIAKLLNSETSASQENALHTLMHDRLLTPEYASPEQIRGQVVTTASDVYSLGIILYELMTGSRPYTLRSNNPLELERSICVMDPVKPSQMLARMIANKPLPLVGAMPKDGNPNVYTPAPDINALAQARTLSPKRLQQRLLGDLDAIIMRALRKEPEQRYSSVEQFIEDIQRHLDQEPVSARQGNWSYYSSRFIRRHALAVTLSSAALMALFGFAVVMSVQAKRIAEQRDKATQESARAESVSNFMQEVFTAADPYQTQDKHVTATELLDKAAQRISNDLSQQPEVRARLLEAIGKSYVNQDQSTTGIRYLEEALRLQRQFSTFDPVRIATLQDHLGRAYFNIGGFDKADQALSEARDILKHSDHTNSREYLQVLTDSGGLEQRLSHPTLAQAYYEQGLALCRYAYGDYHPETAAMLMQLAQTFAWRSNYTRAEKLLREAVQIYHTTLPEKHPDRVNADLSLADLLYLQGQFSEAIVLITQGLSDQKAVYGDNSPRLLSTYDSLSKVQASQRRWSDAENSARLELSIAEKTLGKDNFDTAFAHATVASVLIKRKSFLEAEKESRTSLRILKLTASSDHQYVASAEYLLAASLVGQHKVKEAEPMLRENMARWTRAEAPPWRAARSESLLGNALLQLRKPKEAATALSHSYEVLSAKDSGADADTIAISKKRVDEYQRCVADHRENSCLLSE